MAGPLDLQLRQGEPYANPLTLTFDAVAVDTAQLQVSAQLRANYGSGLALAFTCPVVVVNATTVTVTLTATKEQTANVDAKPHRWDLFVEAKPTYLTPPSFLPLKLLKGVATCEARVTR